jgi:hypothetical protein
MTYDCPLCHECHGEPCGTVIAPTHIQLQVLRKHPTFRDAAASDLRGRDMNPARLRKVGLL